LFESEDQFYSLKQIAKLNFSLKKFKQFIDFEKNQSYQIAPHFLYTLVDKEKIKEIK